LCANFGRCEADSADPFGFDDEDRTTTFERLLVRTQVQVGAVIAVCQAVVISAAELV
jgi:hypothetical protein